MERIKPKTMVVSYLLTSLVIFALSAFTSMIGVYGDGMVSHSTSAELMAVIQLTVVLVGNFLLHLVFYYGNFNCSPITKGVGVGTLLGVVYFLFSVFVLNVYNINTDSVLMLLSGMSGRIVEYGIGGVATAVISVSDIGRWGLLRAF